jgi:alpha-D-xyloside xylohydrolase
MKAPQHFLLSLLAVILLPMSHAGADAVTAWSKDGEGLSVTMGKETLRIRVCNDRILRVQYAKEGPIKPLPDIIQSKKWEPCPFTVIEESERLLLKTKSVTASIDKAKGLLSFADVSGKPFLSEPSAGSRTVRQAGEGTSCWKVQQSFTAAPDEFLYGMGQYQEGVWNWRGMPLELRQHNTQAVVPLLVSSLGYGVLWNNASWSFLNPCDEQIPLARNSTIASAEGPKSTEELQGAIAAASPASSSTPSPKPKQPFLRDNTGTFTPKESGPYVFHVLDGSRSQELSLQLEGKTLTGITNMWTPYAISGVADLKAGVPVKLTVRSKNDSVRLMVRPRGDLTVFRSTQGDLIDYTVFFGPDLEQVIAGYREATGVAPLLPRWAYGFWQCRERYASSQELLDAVDGFRSRHLPMDLIVQDWQYWGKYGWGSYQWDEKFYPDPKALIQGLHDRHAKFMISVWPNPHGKAGDAIKEAKGFINREVYDVTNPDIRALRWKFLNEAFFSIGTDAWWQDAAEPLDDGNPMESSTTFMGSGNLWRNAYPFFHSECVYEGQRAADPSKRVCNLTRSAYLGQQRFGTIVWSGDVAGDWITFRRQIPAGLNFCMAGIPYWTTDCGGFFRPDDEYQSSDYNELQARWFEWSTFCPILRIHGYKTKTEIWNWLPETQRILADYDTFRYRLLPYTYSEAWQVTSAGSTLMRALALDFRLDPKALGVSDEYLFGKELLVAPVTEPKAGQRTVYLPKGADWIDFWTGEVHRGGETVQAAAPLERIPLYAKAGSILPLGPSMEWSDQKPSDPIELRVYSGSDGSFSLYEDSGDSYDYEKGAHTMIQLSWNEAERQLTIGPCKGSFPGMLAHRIFHIVWVDRDHGTGLTEAKPDQFVSYDGTEVSIKKP